MWHVNSHVLLHLLYIQTSCNILVFVYSGANQKVAIVLTDGVNNQGDLYGEIAKINRSEIDVFAVGVDGYSQSELEAITADTSRVYTVQEFDELATLINDLRVGVC